jgi:hypothetical protein
MINSEMHGYIDYLMGLVLIAIPFLFAIPDGVPTTLLIVLGTATIVYSLITNYELGLVKVLPMKVHLFIDVVSGLLLIAAPWLFGFADIISWPFVVLGMLEVGAALMTKNKPFSNRYSQLE